jgi:hypothetical protein
MIQLRGGERVNPREFPADFLKPMHEKLDAIASEAADEEHTEATA